MNSSSQNWKSAWPLIAGLLRERRAFLAIGIALMAVNRAAMLVLPVSTRYLVDDILVRRQRELLPILIGVLMGATALQGITSFALSRLFSTEAQRLIAELRCMVQRHVMRLPVYFFDCHKTGALVSRIMSDVEGLRNLVGTGLIEFIGGLLTGAIALVALMKLSPLLTAMTVILIVMFILFTRKTFPKIRSMYRERSGITAEITGRLAESLSGIRVVKCYSAEFREIEVFAGGIKRLLTNGLQSLRLMSTMGAVGTALTGLSSGIVIYVGAELILRGALTIGAFVTFTALLAYVVGPVFQSVNMGAQFSELLAGLDRTREILDQKPEEDDFRRTIAVKSLEGEVEFDHVSFAYDGGKTVLKDISFEARPGTVTALVGPSGSGKSTIISLLAGFYAPTSGSVFMDRIDLRTVVLGTYRRQLGVVLQESFLFDGSIRDNVGLARLDASCEEIYRACRIAHVDEFVERLERGYDTIIGERGIRLSGGQRQRISIARAIIADPRILILDEATSSLDSESEQFIQDGLSYLMKGRTTLVIAHRLSTIRRADQILVINDGRIIERGVHDTLFAEKGRYWDLYTRQYGVEMNLFLAPGEGDESMVGKQRMAAGVPPLNGMAEPKPWNILGY